MDFDTDLQGPSFVLGSACIKNMLDHTLMSVFTVGTALLCFPLNYWLCQHSTVVTVLEQVLVLFRAGTVSLLSGLRTFLVPEQDHAKNFC